MKSTSILATCVLLSLMLGKALSWMIGCIKTQKTKIGTTQMDTCIECESGFYKMGVKNFFYCMRCLPTCESCTSSGTCTSCKAGNYMSDLKKCLGCDSRCASCRDYSTCTGCYDGYYLRIGSCRRCMEDCATCTDDTLCTSCNRGDFLRNGWCNTCMEGCATCIDDTSCTSCQPGYQKISEPDDTFKCMENKPIEKVEDKKNFFVIVLVCLGIVFALLVCCNKLLKDRTDGHNSSKSHSDEQVYYNMQHEKIPIPPTQEFENYPFPSFDNSVSDTINSGMPNPVDSATPDAKNSGMPVNDSGAPVYLD